MTSQRNQTGWAPGFAYVAISVFVGVVLAMLQGYQEFSEYVRTWALSLSGGALLILFTNQQFLSSWPKWRKFIVGWALWFSPFLPVAALALIGGRELYDEWHGGAFTIGHGAVGLLAWTRYFFPELFVKRD